VSARVRTSDTLVPSIPVYLEGQDPDEPTKNIVGVGKIDADGDLVILVKGSEITSRIVDLAEVSMIVGLNIGLAYHAAEPYEAVEPAKDNEAGA
jgi:hypothetical protein